MTREQYLSARADILAFHNGLIEQSKKEGDSVEVKILEESLRVDLLFLERRLFMATTY